MNETLISIGLFLDCIWLIFFYILSLFSASKAAKVAAQTVKRNIQQVAYQEIQHNVVGRNNYNDSNDRDEDQPDRIKRKQI